MNNVQFQNGLRQLNNELAEIVAKAPYVQSQEILGLSLKRIFNEGKATDGSQIGTYDDKRKQTFLTKKAKSSFNKRQLKALEKTGEELTYKELRQARGLQVAFVDLQFTGALFENLSTGQTQDGAVIGHRNLDEAKIAGHLTKKYNKPIFPPTLEEQEKAKELMKQYVIQEFRKSIQNIFNAK